MGSARSRAGSNFEMPMSALGQKQTSAHLGRMSALPPKADIAEGDWHCANVRETGDYVLGHWR
jgi:hypothetical protein